jgi:tetratricopeptide (TPR) repeat protein
MSKSFLPTVAVALSLVLGTISVTEVAQAQTKNAVSKAAQKPLKASQDAAAAKNYAESIAKANEALALPNKTPYDAYIANQFLAFAYSRQGNAAEFAKATEAQLDSGFPSASEQTAMLKQLAAYAYRAKNYAKAVDFSNRVIRNGGGDSDTYTTIGQSYYQQGQYAQAGKFLGEFVSDQEKRGQVPKEQSLQLMSAAYDKANDSTGVANAMEKLVTHYPKPSYWNGLLYSLTRSAGVTDRHKLHIYRLMEATDTLKQANDYNEMAQLAIEAGTPGEAKAVLEKAFAANVFTEQTAKDRNTRLLESTKKADLVDLAGLAKLEKEAATDKTGSVDVALGAGYLSHGMADKAVAAITRGIGKGGVRNTAEANILLGMAQLKINNKAEAAKTFRGIKSDDPIYQRIAKLWSLHAS